MSGINLLKKNDVNHIHMPDCNEMKKGDVYVCEECGLELQVIKECKDSGTSDEGCTPATPVTLRANLIAAAVSW